MRPFEQILVALFCAAFGSVLMALWVWQDRPAASDAGQPGLSGWLVDTFGPQLARPVGVALFSGIALLLVVVMVLFVRWLNRSR